MATKTRKLPKFNNQLQTYTNGDYVTNPFSGEGYELDAEELAIYDYIIGLQYIIERYGGAFNPATAVYQSDMRKGLDWFRKYNAEAYMVLLD